MNQSIVQAYAYRIYRTTDMSMKEAIACSAILCENFSETVYRILQQAEKETVTNGISEP